jgi:nitrogen fixation/metabolism regulation signal transduction histidine kinase
METVLSEVSYEPHFNVLTKSGKAHFSNVKDALCELVDNSIQATKDNGAADGRTIKVFIELGLTAGSSYVVVWDNGRGMDVGGIKEFATYFHGQRDR